MPKDLDREFRPTASQAAGYANRKVAESTNAADMAIAGINTSGAVIRELISTVKSNPIMGVILAGIVIDVAFKAKLIDAGMKNTLVACLVTAFGVTVAMDVATGIISAVEGGSNADTNLIQPSAQTIVENPPAAANASTPNRSGGLAGMLASVVKSAAPAAEAA